MEGADKALGAYKWSLAALCECPKLLATSIYWLVLYKWAFLQTPGIDESKYQEMHAYFRKDVKLNCLGGPGLSL